MKNSSDDNKRLLFSVTADDVEWQTFCAGGKGGQHQNKRETGVRCIHAPSGAVGESREERSQLTNKRRAFRRMAESSKFKIWHAKECARLLGHPSVEELVDASMHPVNLKIEYYGGK